MKKTKKDRNPYYLKDSGAPAKESMRQDLNLRPLRPERLAHINLNFSLYPSNSLEALEFSRFFVPKSETR